MNCRTIVRLGLASLLPLASALSLPSPATVTAPTSTSLASGAAAFAAALQTFAATDELPELRARARAAESELRAAVGGQDFAQAAALRDELTTIRLRDPVAVAESVRAELEVAVRKERYANAIELRDRLMVLRRFLPQFQLAGVWKGNYPNHGDELVRLHYDGDQLYATKMTGDAHVPAGEVTFRADLTMPYDEAQASAPSGEEVGVRVEVISLAADDSHQQREVDRFKGEGRIAARGFQHAHFVPGQLFLLDADVIGFLWQPLGTFVVFSRETDHDGIELASTGDVAAVAAVAGEDVSATAESDDA